MHNRRGGAGIAPRPTALAYERLSIKAPHGGDSAQHEFLVTRLAQRIPGALVETMLGGKSIDILFRLTPDHARLLTVLGKHFEAHREAEALVTSEDLYAIEVETTAATVVNNAAKNLNVGIAFNIAALMPKAIEAANRALQTELSEGQRPRVVIANVFDILEALDGNNDMTMPAATTVGTEKE